MKHTVIGTLAHVDAGKTTLSESLLYTSGSIRTWGRVDHGNAFLDYNSQERSRGITIFSKQAILTWNDMEITLMDTPGHVDFSSEMERTLKVLDYAIVIINGIDGVQSHTETIWNLLKHYQIPAFIFINKMDITHLNEEQLMKNLRKRLDERCVNFSDTETMIENIAMCEDALLDTYMSEGTLTKEEIMDSIEQRKVFPCYFGSALKNEGIKQFLDGLDTYCKEKTYPEAFGAKVYQITRDQDGNKLVHMKITGGSLKVKTKFDQEEKADQIRRYSGTKYQMIEEASAGMICAVKGLNHAIAGEGLGIEQHIDTPVLMSYMNYRMVLPEGCDAFKVLKQLQQLAEEDPQLNLIYNEKLAEIRVQIMGEIQIEILKNMIKDRFNIDVEFDQGSINYKETILNTVEGVGHFEPLRHYAEVHVLLEPAERGSGLQFYTNCPEEELAKNWQRLILTHLQEREHPGVLTGSSITDMKITLLTGKAHNKHTEGGDFRQATYRAIRHGLRNAQCILLEPYFKFRLELPIEYMSRAIYDIETMNGTFEIINQDETSCVLSGSASVSKMQNYQSEVVSYSKGKGKLYCVLKDYEPCLDQESIIEQIGYDCDSDVENPCGSIFCSHGAGFYVPWDEVTNYMHVHSAWSKQIKKTQTPVRKESAKIEEDLETIFLRTYGSAKTKQNRSSKNDAPSRLFHNVKHKPLCMLVDGYNIIHSWPELKEIAKDNIDAARMKLIQMMGDFQGYKQCLLILVFDAYQVEDGIGSMVKDHNIYVVYTKQAQTADMYIEKATHDFGEHYHIIVATSDGMEQLIVIGQGAHRMSSRELKLEFDTIKAQRKLAFEQKEGQVFHQPLAKLRDVEIE